MNTDNNHKRAFVHLDDPESNKRMNYGELDYDAAFDIAWTQDESLEKPSSTRHVPMTFGDFIDRQLFAQDEFDMELSDNVGNSGTEATTPPLASEQICYGMVRMQSLGRVRNMISAALLTPDRSLGWKQS